ncbi:MAG: HEAT repeat domain-containing protein [Acidobacteriota bacterium]|nr:HEAT repeat domain-containing protein [Acidobacteriota bacterium]
MNCDAMAKAIPVYVYGELAPEIEENIEEHCATCVSCDAELKRYQKLGSLLDNNRTETPPHLLAHCRQELASRIAAGSVGASSGASRSWWPGWHALLHSSVGMRVPVGAIALIALGYFGARLTPVFTGTVNTASLGSEGMLSSVRSIQPDQSGRVQIAVDETRRRVISGRLSDPGIQRVLLTAVRDEANPGVRVESMDALQNQASSIEVRRALSEALMRDPNPGVRLKALEGLKSFATDPEVRKTLSQVLLQDANPGVRIQVIDLLVAHHDQAMVGVLQNLVRKEDNSYVRSRCENALQDLNASVGTF